MQNTLQIILRNEILVNNRLYLKYGMNAKLKKVQFQTLM